MVFLFMWAFIRTLKSLMWRRMKKVLSRRIAYLKTSKKGIYAVGDCRDTPIWQLVAAVRDGALAATAANEYIERSQKTGYMKNYLNQDLRDEIALRFNIHIFEKKGQ